MTESNHKCVVLVSKPLPKLLRDLSRIRTENPEAVQLVINKKGTIVATTLADPALDKEKNNDSK